MFKKNILFSFILLAAFIGLSSWGFLVHRTVNQLAVYNLPAPLQGFFHANMEYLVENAPRPDNRKRLDKTEDTKHYINVEQFGPNAMNEMPSTATAIGAVSHWTSQPAIPKPATSATAPDAEIFPFASTISSGETTVGR